MNCRSEFERFPGRGRFHVRAGRNESRPMVGTTALTDRTHADLIRTLGARRDGGHGGEEKNFRRAVAWRKLAFRLVESVKQSKEKVCEDESVPAMMCIAKLTGVWCSRAFRRLTGKCKDGLY